jgi:hypothetical protein
MPFIKARTTKTRFVRHITRLYAENNETLFAYAAFIDEHSEYVLNQLVETVLAKDKDFVAWLEQHPGSHVPRPGSAKRKPVSTGVKRPSPHANARPTSALGEA